MLRWSFLPLVALSAAVAGAQVPTSTPTPGTIVRLELKPVTKTISVGEFANYTATGFDAQGLSKNMTQKVEYTSSDPTVAGAPNAADNRGRVNGLKPGVVTISAADAVTGVSTTDAGGVSGTLTVQGALVAITLKPLDKNAVVGDAVTYTATGQLSDGNTKNLTQKVEYASSDTSVAVCPNAEGNKSRVEAVGVGTAIITATDPVTSIATEAEGSGTLTVRVPGATATGRTPTPTPRATPTLCGDPNASNTVTVTDGVEVLSAAADLPTGCTAAVCDVDGSGAVTVTDGVLVLRFAAGLDGSLACP
ncbi:MAG: Ig-like domain-containing protein [Deltaproteobacteria bacterium]|nr:Ig-like domain-containing protein [Deltaproteobacteria bacterium]